MTETAKKNMFLESPIFENIPREKVLELFRTVQHMIVPANTIVFKQEDPGDSFYIIYSGKARVFRERKTGVKIELSILGPGDCIGEMSLLTGRRRSAYLKTMEETHLLVLSKAQFDRALAKYPDIAKTFVKQMSDKLIIEREAKRLFKLPGASWFDYFIIIALSLLFAIIFNQANPNGISLVRKKYSNESISIVDTSTVIKRYHEGKAIFIDARPSAFFEQAHIEGAVNIPLAIFDLMYMMELSEADKKEVIIIYGRTISRHYDEQMADKLMLRGYKNVMVFKGGLSDWKKRGLPIKP